MRMRWSWFLWTQYGFLRPWRIGRNLSEPIFTRVKRFAWTWCLLLYASAFYRRCFRWYVTSWLEIAVNRRIYPDLDWKTPSDPVSAYAGKS